MITKHKHKNYGKNKLNKKDVHKNRSCSVVCNHWYKGIKSIFRREDFKEQIPLHLPMYAWTWQQLVSYIESKEEMKKFSSVFWEYRINGQEICNMKSKQIELLIECSVLNNSKFTQADFDEFKLLSKRNAFYGIDPESNEKEKNQWELTLAADDLYEFIVKGRVESQIVSRYYTAWDIVKQIANKKNNAQCIKAQTIVDLMTLLRSNPNEGPKKFWFVLYIIRFCVLLIIENNRHCTTGKQMQCFLIELIII